MKKVLRVLGLFTFVLAVPCRVFGATLPCRGDDPTIQEGIDAAAGGDLVLAARGSIWEKATGILISMGRPSR